ncbi:Tetratricopeptide repeat protein 1 [Cryptotermes secundus]|uniref:Tetratricopeptide repeat protein 1 n=1 Tax=Cryptotermes secundus TaxID=105785 RepID=A0A2J7RFQ7_9NEOP|nr:tetratricopeptide repeat protein 1 [Cryptotermes secundus]PNF39669.1 Tetratricopeptide repeat protein 1 [Cryptotermes secundus]PNF39670.1 Tetratricopeptide repeat protein 1 [Cryptotermes secundus]
MAEKSSSLDDDETSCKQYVIPSNEEIINELTKDLHSSSIEAAEDTNSVRDKHDERKLEKEDINVGKFEEDITKVSAGDSDKSENEEDHVEVEDDFIDEEALKDFEITYSAEDKERLRKEADTLKSKGNEQFKAGNYRDSAQSYTLALRTCPLAFDKDRAVMYSNRAATKVKLGLKPSAIEDCSKAIELNPVYLKAYFRRAQLYEEVEKLDEALADYKKVLELDPLHREALYTSRRLAEQIQERNEKLKTEMLGKLKDLGNMILRPFGLSTNNFQVTQDPNSGGYSVNFQQTPR